MILKADNRILYIFLFLLVFALYFNSIFNNYSLDDHLINDQNPLTQTGIKNISEVIENYSFSEKNSNYAFRPVMLATFVFEYSLFGTNPQTSHIISIILFGIFVLLLFRLLNIAFPQEKMILKLIALLLFIAHPVHTEIVDNIKSRDELLVGIFGISMLIQFFKYLNDSRFYRMILIGILFFLGYFSKQSILIYAGIIITYAIYLTLIKERRLYGLLIFIIVILVTFISIRILKRNLVSGEILNRDYLFCENPLIESDLISRIPAGLSIGLVYLKLLIWPLYLSFYYGYNQISIHDFGDFLPYLSIAIYGLVIFLSIKYFWKNKLVIFSLILLFVNIIGVSNIFILLPGIVAERFILIGSAGFSILTAIFILKISEKLGWIKENANLKVKSLIIIILIFLTYSLRTITRNQEWKDSFTLVTGDCIHLGKSAKAMDLASYQYITKSRSEKNPAIKTVLLDSAIVYCKKCIDIYPEYISCWNNMGTIYFDRGDFENARKSYLSAISIDSNDANPLFNLGNIFYNQQKFEKADSFYYKALILDPDLFNLIPVYKQFILDTKNTGNGILRIKEVLKSHPENYSLHLLIIDFYNEKHDYPNMLKYLEKANQIRQSDELEKYISNIKKIIGE